VKEYIPIAEPFITGKELEYVTDCLRSGWISSIGAYILRFEREFALYCGCRYGIATSNGTAALHLALAVLGIGPGDEVIVPTLTFVATANCVVYTGAKPVFVDSEPKTWNIAPGSVAAKITSRTKAIIPVHLYGHPVDMDPILELARKHGLYVIEDAAEAHGAEYKGKKVGSLGNMGCFSFYGNKIITTGEGGMLVTDDEEFAERARMLRDHCMSKEKRYWHPAIGYNYRMTNLQGAIGVAQMEHIEEFIAIKRRNAQLYNTLLANVHGITLPPEQLWAKNVYWMYSILIEDDFGLARDEVALRLKDKGIDTRPFFSPLHTMPPYACSEQYPVAEELSREGINLPSATTLKREQIERVCAAIRSMTR
jgi:perosamine synthetase